MSLLFIYDILNRFQLALDRFCERDRYLLDYDVSERAITHKLGEHLQSLFEDFDVDCEYNRNGHEPKRVHLPDPGDPEAEKYVSIYPDVIVHRRGSTLYNRLIVEAKKSIDGRFDGEERDRQKLIAYSRELQYTVGVFVVFDVRSEVQIPYVYDCYYNDLWHSDHSSRG